MELWAMVVQYACAAAGAAAVVRLVDGCGKGAKKRTPPRWSSEAFSWYKAQRPVRTIPVYQIF